MSLEATKFHHYAFPCLPGIAILCGAWLDRLFEEGIRLSRFCNQKLEEVEKKIELILADAKGQPVTEPFEMEEEPAPSEERDE